MGATRLRWLPICPGRGLRSRCLGNAGRSRVRRRRSGTGRGGVWVEGSFLGGDVVVVANRAGVNAQLDPALHLSVLDGLLGGLETAEGFLALAHPKKPALGAELEGSHCKVSQRRTRRLNRHQRRYSARLICLALNNHVANLSPWVAMLQPLESMRWRDDITSPGHWLSRFLQ